MTDTKVRIGRKFQYLEIFLVSFVIFCGQLYSIYNFHSSDFLLPSNPDRVLFADIIGFMSSSGIETQKINYLQPLGLHPTPYHFFELWFTGLLAFIFESNAMILDHLVSASIFGTIIYMGARAIAEYLNVSFFYSVIAALILAVLNFEIQLQSLEQLEFLEVLKSTSVYFQLSAIEYSKFFPIYILLLASIIFFLHKEYLLSFLFLSMLPIINILLYPSILSASLILLPIAFCKRLISRYEFLLMLSITFFISIFIFIFYFVVNAFSETILEESLLSYQQEILGLILSQTSFNILVGSFIQAAYALLPCILIGIFYHKKFLIFLKHNQAILFIFLMLLVISITGAFAWAILHFHPESSQFYIRHAHVVINILSLFTLFFLFELNKPKAWIVISAILLIKVNYAAVELNNYREMSTNYYSQNFLNIAKKELEDTNRRGAYISSKTSLKSIRGKSINHRIGNFTSISNQGLNLTNISDYSMLVSSKPLIQFIEKGMLSDHPFSIYVALQKSSGEFNSISLSQYTFILDNNISYLVLAASASPSKKIIPLISKSFTDPFSGETLLILKTSGNKT
ncbi:hypothetical protein N9K82_02520 [Gammaproteobacteria bacterium]|nr:hypothetical protein [Gammaproteobacteria bacterium]